MWRRAKALFRALFGWLIRSAEDPEMLLRQHMDDLRMRLPEMNRQVAEVVKLEKMLEMQVEQTAKKIAFIQPQVEKAVAMGPAKKEAAKLLIVQLEREKEDLATNTAQLEQAKANSEKAKQMRAAYERKIRDQVNECMRQISRAKQAEMQEKISQVMGSFEIGDDSEVLDRTKAQIDERLARAQARTEVASESTEAQLAAVDECTAADEAEKLYAEYQRQLGIETEEAGEKTMESIPSIEQENN